jgi:polyisoprenoid-binding protein YceI
MPRSLGDDSTSSIRADRYPVITGVLRSVAEDTLGRYLMKGELTLRGRTRVVEGEAAVNVGEDGRLHFDGAMEVDIRDFGIDPPNLLIVKVHPVLEVGLTFVADPDANPR